VKVTQIVEAILFASDAPLKAEEIARADEALDEDIVDDAIHALQAEYGEGERAFQIVELAEGYQILTRAEFAPYLERFDTVPRPSRLSGPSLETLAIIAYRQPLGRIEMEYVRGVACGGVIRTLQDRGLIDVVGRAEGIGRPLLYGTTQRFLDHFGFRSVDDLPRPEELPVVLRERIPLGPEEPESPPAEGTTHDQAMGIVPEPEQASLGLEAAGAVPDEVAASDDDAAPDAAAGSEREPGHG
jgi:segregation and condensation protein B